MNHSDDIDDFLDRLPPMTDAEGAEVVLDYLNAALRDMSTETLRLFRMRCLEMHRGEPEQATVIEVIDGMLALREMDGA